MSEEEEIQAAEALIEWFKSQEIKPAYAVLVMVRTIGCAIAGMHGKKGRKRMREGAKIVSKMIESIDF